MAFLGAANYRDDDRAIELSGKMKRALLKGPEVSIP